MIRGRGGGEKAVSRSKHLAQEVLRHSWCSGGGPSPPQSAEGLGSTCVRDLFFPDNMKKLWFDQPLAVSGLESEGGALCLWRTCGTFTTEHLDFSHPYNADTNSGSGGETDTAARCFIVY